MQTHLNSFALSKAAIVQTVTGCDRGVARTHGRYSIEENEEEDDKEVAVGEQGRAGCYNSHENGHGRH